LQQAVEVGQIILSVLLTGVILLQSRGSSFGGGMGGDTGSIYHRRRGLEKTLFQLTIALAVFFVVVAVVSAAVTG
jgi:preprotein translocase subunit SecG